MNKIILIIKREYLSRVRKKSFLIMTILGPILMAGLILAPLLIESPDTEQQLLWVCDDSGLFESKFEKLEAINTQILEQSVEEVKLLFKESDAVAFVHIPDTSGISLKELENNVNVFAHKPISITTKKLISRNIEAVIESIKLKNEGLTKETINKTRADVNLNTIIMSESGSEQIGSTEIAMGIS